MTHATALPRLTGRQRDVLERIAAGETNIEIATALGIGFETVKMHVSDVLAELGVDSREDAARVWKERPGPIRRTLQALAPVFSIKSAGAITAGAALVSGAMVFALAQYSGSTGRAAAPDPGSEVSEPAPTTSLTGDPTAFHATIPLPAGTSTENLFAKAYADGHEFFAWQDGAASPGYATFTGDALPNRPAEVRIEVVRFLDNNVRIPITSVTVPWNGYTSPVTDVPLPDPVTAPLGPLTFRLLEVFTTPDRVGIRWQIEGLPAGLDMPLRNPALTTANGDSVENISNAGFGFEDGAPMTRLSSFAHADGPVTFHVRYEVSDLPGQPDLTDEQIKTLTDLGAISGSITIDLP